MDQNLQYGMQSTAGQASRNIGKAAFIAFVEGFKMLSRFIGQMVRMFLGK